MTELPNIDATGAELDGLGFLRHSIDPYVLMSREGQLLWFNPALSLALGCDSSPAEEVAFWGRVHPEDVQATQHAMAELEANGSVRGLRHRLQCSDATWRWFEWNAAVDDGGRWVCTGRDVTEFMNEMARRSLREEHVSMASEIGKTGYWVADLLNDTLFWSDEIFRIHGFEPGAFQPTLALGIEAYHPGDREYVQECVSAAIAEQRPFEFECRLLQPDGSHRLVEAMGRPEVDARTGAVVRLFGVFRDITDDERSRRYRELEQFAYVASHDLLTPVRTIKSFVELLLESVEEPTSVQQQYATFIDDAATRLNRLIADLKSYAESGARVPVTLVDPNTSLANVLVDLQRDVEEVGARIDTTSLPKIPANLTLLEQVFQNLLTNAIRYRSSERPLEIGVSATVHGDRVHIQVADNGIGFDNKYAESIFEPFRRLDTGRSGTGIGLAIAQRMVRQCKGELTAQGVVGQGATFTLDFPLG